MDRDFGQGVDGIFGELERQVLGCHQSDILLDQAGFGLSQNSPEIVLVSARSSTRIGSRPCNSGSRSDGLDT
jgi:hypothetical protein